MKKIWVFSLSSLLIVALALLFWLVWTAKPALGHQALPTSLSGQVLNAVEQKPLADALVQWQGTPNQTTTDENGQFTLNGIKGSQAITITAWVEGYYVGWTKVDPNNPAFQPSQALSITLKTLYTTDNYKYPWFSFQGVTGSASCGLCHRENAEWQRDAHSQAAVNPRFITLYQGTDVAGNKGQLTAYGSSGKALDPDPAQPYYGPGYKLDNPQRSGNCATCHTPLAAKIPNQKNCGWSGCHTYLTSERAANTMDAGVSPLYLTGDAAEGITCDFCHKVGDVILDPQTQLPLADMPGILSMRLFRPEEGKQLFFGTVKDVSRRVTYSALETQSEFCAPCHYGVFGGVVGNGTVSGGVVIYNSYGEWLESPYSDPQTGKTCQQCHMAVSDANYFVFPEKGGITRDYVELHTHYMPGAADTTLLQNSVTLKSTATRSGGKVQVTVNITNDQTGHSIPTDAPIREMILIVEAFGADGKPLALDQGSILPAWTGNFANLPGKTYSKILRDDWSGEMPTAAYWRPVTLVQDTRLAAMATDTTSYSFELAAGQAAKINVRLIFRRAFQGLAAQKGWTDADILMEEATIQVEK
jgi:hypothetical protein